MPTTDSKFCSSSPATAPRRRVRPSGSADARSIAGSGGSPRPTAIRGPGPPTPAPPPVAASRFGPLHCSRRFDACARPTPISARPNSTSCSTPGVSSTASPCPVSPPSAASSPERPTRCGTPRSAWMPGAAPRPQGAAPRSVRLRYRGAPPGWPPPRPVYLHRSAHPLCRRHGCRHRVQPPSHPCTRCPVPSPAGPPRFILSDNGSEFLGHFQQRLDERGSTHWGPYPRSPKMNAHAERLNRTLQETFVDDHEDLLFDDLTAFNRKLADWLLAYNTVLPHHSLGRQSPVQCLIQHQPNPSTKGGGPIQRLDKSRRLAYKSQLSGLSVRVWKPKRAHLGGLDKGRKLAYKGRLQSRVTQS